MSLFIIKQETQASGILRKMNPDKGTDKMKPKISFNLIGREEHMESTYPVITGYPILDTLLCGGIPQKFAVALTSQSCDERDLLIKRFLETGAENGETTFYVTIDPILAGDLALKYSSTFYLFVCNPQEEAILKSAPNILILKGVENLTNLSLALTSAIRKLDLSQKINKRICLNVVSDVLLQNGVVQTRRWLTELITQLKSVGFTTLAVLDPKIHPPEQLHAILGLFEGEVDIHETETAQGLARFMEVKRLSSHKYLKDEAYLTEEEQQDQRTSYLGDSDSRGFIRLS